MNDTIKLTQYSHGAGCGCKIAPDMLDQILHSNFAMPDNKNLIVGNHSKDDAAVYDLGNGTALISTTDFFMPIVDDPYEFGRIASANAISDVYAMGGKPVLAIAILGWPINKLAPEIARRVIEGSRSICLEAGIPLAGGHSIDSPEPIFGLAVNGIIPIKNIKQNNQAKEGDILFLTKPLGVGILTTAEKKGILAEKDIHLAARQMMQLNKAGETFGQLEEVHAMTDVTGFGLLGHLLEMADGSGVSAVIHSSKLPLISPDLPWYIGEKSVPGGTQRNWNSYGQHVKFENEIGIDITRSILADPQTSGGLLVALDPAGMEKFREILIGHGLEAFAEPIGFISAKNEYSITVK